MIARMTAAEAAQMAERRARDGCRFVWLFCDAHGDRPTLRYVVERDGRLEIFEGAAAGDVPSFSATIPAIRWYEQEVRDKFGVAFHGLDDVPIVRDPEVDAERMRRALGDEVSTVLYGPVRSGIVESACWVIETAGEDFIAVHPWMFFKHRGLERRFVGTPLELAPFVAEHVSGVTPSSHATAFCSAVEALFGIEISPRARAAREMLIELERVHQHLDSLAKLADDGSLSVGSAMTFAAKERVHRFLVAATGHRFGRGTICVGGLREDAFASLTSVAERELDALQRDVCDVVDGLFGTQSLLDRLVGTGRLSADIVRAYGGVGPVARGSGVMNDARFSDGWQFAQRIDDELRETDGDAISRARVRAGEIRASLRAVRVALESQPEGRHRANVDRIGSADSGEAFARVESPQGELLYFVRYDGGLQRVAIRSASFANWPLFVPALPGNIFTDFSFIEHSFGLIQAETDR